MQTDNRTRVTPVYAGLRNRIILLLLCACAATGCKKLVTIDEPINSITTAEVFSTDQQATAAMSGLYSKMINADLYSSFSNGAITMYGGFSADEFIATYDPQFPYYRNQLTAVNASSTVWNTAYQTIYNANSIIEGIAAANGAMHDSVKTELTGEALFVRAFAYYYLTGLYGDVPLVLTVNFNQTANLVKSPQAAVYQQVIQDLLAAQAALPADYSAGAGERIRPSKMAATALLARVYLHTHNYNGAAEQASALINNTTLYGLETDLNNVFLANSREAIWQLQQNTSDYRIGNATPEGIAFMPVPLNTGAAGVVQLAPPLLAAFEPGDHRRTAWVDSSDASQSGTPSLFYFPYKYKTGKHNTVVGGTATEYLMVLRLGEQYLVRAEAELNGAPGGVAAAIADLNVIRSRAGLLPLPATLSQAAVTTALAHERQVELFAEWGHRWLDLLRTGQAHAVLSQITYKQPWQGDYQLLYPIPQQELLADPNLKQNDGY